MENFIIVEKKDQFSLIEVYPYLHYERNNEDEDNLFQESLDPQNFKVTIGVRSAKAKAEVVGWLIGHGFDKIKTMGKANLVPAQRIYFVPTMSEFDFLMGNKEQLLVKFSAEELDLFKETIKELAKRLGYGNMWKEGDHFVIK